MNINKMQGNPAFLDVCQCSKEPQKCVVLSLSRLKHGFDCSAALQVSPGSHLCSYAPLRSFLARGRPFDAAGDTRPAGEISAPRPSVRLRTFGYTSPVRSHAGQRKHESQAPVVAAAKSSLPSSIFAVRRNRSEERRVGKECVSKCRSRWAPYH